ncbi:hypothetical protein RHSIM_Rhsim03G0098500 [Rhododendron simsii]|uniref:MADS-box domain-containing protein n=1 Tax=Rhododendron simsii TaxID=118357 RepID=A0A834H7A3_RHOSS|nr:hypothetical protein RHSIM_Rhsim03G0098500 [Rhododendron simsii]
MLGFWLYATFLAFTELKLIEDKNSHQVSFSKRRSGLMKKASELSVLCDVDISLFISLAAAASTSSAVATVVRVVSAVIMAIWKAVPLGLATRSWVAPQGNRVLIRLEELPEKLAGGVLLPKAAVKFERYLMGEVSKYTISTSAAVKLI